MTSIDHIILDAQALLHTTLSLTPSERARIQDWEEGKTIGIAPDKDDKFVPTTGKDGVPIFQKLLASGELQERAILQDDEFLAMVPGKVKGVPNSFKESEAGKSALMALMHLLIIPKKRRIFNAVTLSPEDTPFLARMQLFGEKALAVLARAGPEVPGSLRWTLAPERKLAPEDLLIPGHFLQLQPRDDFEMGVLAAELSQKQAIETYLHMYPTPSMAWLHLHVISGPTKTTAFHAQEEAWAHTAWRKQMPLRVIAHRLEQARVMSQRPPCCPVTGQACV